MRGRVIAADAVGRGFVTTCPAADTSRCQAADRGKTKPVYLLLTHPGDCARPPVLDVS
jgi:hypothetical protein